MLLCQRNGRAVARAHIADPTRRVRFTAGSIGLDIDIEWLLTRRAQAHIVAVSLNPLNFPFNMI